MNSLSRLVTLAGFVCVVGPMLTGCGGWRSDYRAAFDRYEALRKDGDRCISPSEFQSDGENLAACELVAGGSRNFKEEVLALETPDEDAKKAKILLLDLANALAEDSVLLGNLASVGGDREKVEAHGRAVMAQTMLRRMADIEKEQRFRELLKIESVKQDGES